jgi:hypothetical protein
MRDRILEILDDYELEERIEAVEDCQVSKLYFSGSTLIATVEEHLIRINLETRKMRCSCSNDNLCRNHLLSTLIRSLVLRKFFQFRKNIEDWGQWGYEGLDEEYPDDILYCFGLTYDPDDSDVENIVEKFIFNPLKNSPSIQTSG